MTENIWVLGGMQTDFARNLVREGGDYASLTAEVVHETLADAGISPAAVQVIHVGNAFGELFAGQGHLGAMPASVEPALWGVPASRHEGACASGSLAILAAMSDLASGRYDCALVLGAEIEKTVDGRQGAEYMGSAAWAGHEGQDAKFMWPYMFAKMADTYAERFGLEDGALHAIAQKNYDNARRNPLAQTRTWDVADLHTCGLDDEINPVVEGRLRRYDCSQMTDGGAGLVLVSDRMLRNNSQLQAQARIAGWGHTTVGLGIAQKTARTKGTELVLPHVAQAARDAWKRAGVKRSDLAGMEVHDCFSISEYLAIDHLGLTAPGGSWQAIQDGVTAIDGSFPINPSGGLIGGGHPVGATGIRMVLDAVKQVTGQAGEYQVSGADKFGTLNIGGSTSTVASFVLENLK